jgi:hypothetical protein
VACNPSPVVATIRHGDPSRRVGVGHRLAYRTTATPPVPDTILRDYAMAIVAEQYGNVGCGLRRNPLLRPAPTCTAGGGKMERDLPYSLPSPHCTAAQIEGVIQKCKKCPVATSRVRRGRPGQRGERRGRAPYAFQWF